MPRFLFTLLVLVLIVPAVPAAADPVEGFAPESVVFPVIGDVAFTDTFGAPRGSDRTHEGTDIMSVGAVKGLPVVAAADGVVDWIGSTCCYLAIDHGDGWETWYIHLDNDTPGTDDGLGWGIADGIEVGTPVNQGEVIGYLGDSGNAEEAGPHLHFEIRKDGIAINPYEFLVAAPRLGEGSAPAPKGYDGQFRDDDDSVHRANIEILFAEGITKGCNPPTNDLYCPRDNLTRGQVAAFLRRNLGLAATDNDYFTDDSASVFEGDINALTEAGIGFGCTETEFCPDAPLSRAEMAEYLVRAYGFDDPTGQDYFPDDDGSRFEDSINALFANRITVGCTPELYCPDDTLTREQMATFIARSLGLGT
ncbi:MAG: peptidoglycan DD-metalloendopeptidase family protein [Acidimicrobiia bacterium]|nr:peptidoglycan DD-metalloendopeptidase family protein [Acidimicrobiia bacterium]